MILIKLFFSILLPYCAGYAALKTLLGPKYKLNRVVVPAVSYGLGLGILSNGMLILNMVGLELTLINIVVMQVLVVTVLLFIGFRIKKSSETKRTRLLEFPAEKSVLEEALPVRILFILFWAAVVYFVYYVFWRSLTIPVYEWDSLASSIFNAKVFYYDRTLAKLPWLPYSIYPLHVPFLYVWTALCIGSWDDQYVKILSPLIYISFSIIYYAFLRYWTGRTWAMLGILFLFSSNLFVFHATLSYRDLFLSYYTCGAVMFLVLWGQKRELVFLILAAVMAGIGTFVKLEGVLYMVIQSLLVIYLVFKEKQIDLSEKIKTILWFIVPCGAIFLLYYVYKTVHGISTVAYMNPDFAGAGLKMRDSLLGFTRALFFTANWNIHWVWLFFSLLFNPHVIKSNKNVRIILLSLCLYLGTHLGISLLLGISSNIISHFTISRLLIHFFPLVPLLIVLINHEVFREGDSFR